MAFGISFVERGMSEREVFYRLFPGGIFVKQALDNVLLSDYVKQWRIQSTFWKFDLFISNSTAEPVVNADEWYEKI